MKKKDGSLPKCAHELIGTREDSSVCVRCGLVVDSGQCDYSAPALKGYSRPKVVYSLGAAKVLYGTYHAIFHFNERLAQLCLQEPPIPRKLWQLIAFEFDYGDFDRTYPDAKQLTKADVARICRSISVPEDLQEEYRSTKFKCNPLKDMNRYTEKWLTIRKKLGGTAPPPMHPNDVEQLQRDFLGLLRPFNYFRHNQGCLGRKCHKSPSKCRHNLPNYNYLILQLLRRRNKHEIYLPWLPQLKTGSKIRNLDSLCQKIWNYLGWNFTPLYQRKKRVKKSSQFPKRKIVKKAIRNRQVRKMKKHKLFVPKDLVFSAPGRYWL